MRVNEGCFEANDWNCVADDFTILNLSLWTEHILNEAKSLVRLKSLDFCLKSIHSDQLYVEDIID